jgi:chromosome segregation ATPase
MESSAIMEFLASAYVYGWAGAVIFFILFVMALRQSTTKSGECERLKKQKEEADSAIEERDRRIEEMESEIESLTEEVEEKDSRISKLESEVSSLESQLETAQSRVKDLEEQVKNLRQQNSSQAETINELKAKISDAEAKIEKLEAQVSQLESDNASLQEKVEDLTSQLNELQYNYDLSILYIHMKKLHEEFYADFTQNILKGIHTMNIKDIDLATAQAIFEAAMNSFNQVTGEEEEGGGTISFPSVEPAQDESDQ